MKKTLLLLLALLFTAAFSSKAIACDAPTNLRSLVEQDVPGYGYKYKVTLSWDAVDNADAYSIYFYSDNYPNGMWLGDTDGLYYIAGANTEAVFYFAVKTHCSDGSTSEQSEQCAVVIEDGASPCLMPTNLQVTIEEDIPGNEYYYTIYLTWDAVDNAAGYEVYINGDHLANTSTNSYTFGTGQPQILYLSVATVCEDGSLSLVSPSIKVDIDPCLPPTNLQATVEENVPGYNHKYKVTLTWDANSDASSYTIYENGLWKGYASTTSFEIGYDNPTTTFFNVTSSCENGESDLTDPLTVVIGGSDEPCNAPTNLGATIEQDVEGYEYKFKVTMTWDAVDGAQAYIVYVNGQQFGASSTNSYIAGSDNEGSFNFTVVTVCANSESEESDPYTVLIQEVSLEEYANKFEIYPNPANEVLFVNTTENINEVNIYNIVGVLVYSNHNFNGTIDLSNFNDGIYFVKINTDKGDITKRFIKQ